MAAVISRRRTSQSTAYEEIIMLKHSVIDKDKSYTFSDYFKLDPPIRDLLAYFGYTYEMQDYPLPKGDVDLRPFEPVRDTIKGNLYQVNLSSKMARREALIAPVILAVARQLKALVEIEYVINVNDQLKGSLDYLIQQQNNFLVVEAKNSDLRNGFTQLAVELIAMDKWFDNGDIIYGAVSMGETWRFGILNRQTKVITRDMNMFVVPTDLDDLLQILLAILQGE